MLEISNLSLELSDFKLHNINLEIEDGEYFILLGASGSGKTLLLESIAGMYSRVNGKVNFNGDNLLELEIEKRGIGFVYQNYELFPFLNVSENVSFGLKAIGVENEVIKHKVDEYLDLFKISHLKHRYPKHLSGGECQRVALARALITSPKMLLLDEPLSSLDRFTKDILIKELKNLNNIFKVTMIHVTHDIDEALYLGEKIGIMKNGRVTKLFNNNQLRELMKEDKLEQVFKMEV
ncbi:MAG: ATP-binding cassette domain-containing protein [Clostridium sp.]